jgi:hypothetical protein
MIRLNEGTKVAILAGRGALGATDELEQLAETLAAPIIKPLLGKACVPDDSRYTTGGIGLLGIKPSQAAIENCDTLLLIGTSFPYIEFYPKPGRARGVQLDMGAVRIGLRCPIVAGRRQPSHPTSHPPTVAKKGGSQRGAADPVIVQILCTSNTSADLSATKPLTDVTAI